MKKTENSTEQTAPHGTYLCYGDFIAFEAKGIEGCAHGGFLGSEDISAATNRMMNTDSNEVIVHHHGHDNLISELRPMNILPIQAHHVPPVDFFTSGIFQVIAGFGFEAAGEPVRYGSQIKLRLKATGEVLSARGDSNLLQLINNIDYEKTSNKECNFRIKTRFDTRAEGEVVYFHDLITLSDYINRSVYCTSSTRVIMVRQPSFQVTGFYLSLYGLHGEVAGKALIGGDVLQLYHRLTTSILKLNLYFLTISSPYLVERRGPFAWLPRHLNKAKLKLVRELFPQGKMRSSSPMPAHTGSSRL